jgi:hypothetical protein
MPGMSGRVLADEISALHPGPEFLAKPFTPPILIRKVPQILDALGKERPLQRPRSRTRALGRP